MAIDPPLSKKRGRSPSSKVEGITPCPKMDQKLALVRNRLALLNSSSDRDSDDDDGNKQMQNRKRESPSKEGQRPFAVGAQQPIEVDDDEHTTLRFLRSTLAEIKKKKPTAETHSAHSADTILIKTTKVSTLNDLKKCESVKPILEARSTSGVHDKSESAMRKAEEIRAKLPTSSPSFAKRMLRSHVTYGFWLGLPANFCNNHLPKHDINMVLEDETGRKFDAKYLGNKVGLSAGWRGFSIDHNIKEGDVVVFQLVSSSTFKVYIVRANGVNTADGALALLSLEACTAAKIRKQQHAKERRLLSCSSSNLSSEVIDGIRFSDSVVVFDDVRTFKDFNIIVDGLVVDTKFPDHLRRTYYELCSSQKSFLHQNLIKGLNMTLVVGVITETTNIADGIKACKKCDSARQDDLLIWKRTLEAFQLLGMDVVFLLERLVPLLGLTVEAKDTGKLEEYKLERARADEKMKLLECKLLEIKDAMKNLDGEMEEMASSVKSSDVKLERRASEPW